MNKPTNKVLEQYHRLVKNVQSTEKLKEYLEDGDWMLLVSCRDSLEEQELATHEQKLLMELDRNLTTYFNASLLDAYAVSELPVDEWWDSSSPAHNRHSDK